LIALLPRRAVPTIPSREVRLSIAGATDSRAIMYVLFMVFVLGAQCLLSSRHPTEKVGDPQVSASSTVVPRDPPPDTGQ
jgi:hypothetical protein